MHYDNPADTEAAFYDAFRNLDIEQMQQVWLDSLDISCIHPGGELLRGMEAIMNSWRGIFRDSTPPQVSHRLIQASADKRLAVHTVEENVSAGNGSRQAVILATNVYGFVNGGWKMLAHHASLPLVESTREHSSRPPLH